MAIKLAMQKRTGRSFDTYMPEDHDSYRGAWGVYPLLPSGNILVSDMQSGLFVLSPLDNQNSSTNLLEKKLSVFPNPFSDEIKISFSNLTDEIKLEFKEKEKKFDPEKVYKDQPNPTKL